MTGYVTNIEGDTIANDDYRRVLFTGTHLQLVLMTLAPGEEIGRETHMEHDQFIRVEAGIGVLMLGSQRHELADGVALFARANHSTWFDRRGANAQPNWTVNIDTEPPSIPSTGNVMRSPS